MGLVVNMKCPECGSKSIRDRGWRKSFDEWTHWSQCNKCDYYSIDSSFYEKNIWWWI